LVDYKYNEVDAFCFYLLSTALFAIAMFKAFRNVWWFEKILDWLQEIRAAALYVPPEATGFPPQVFPSRDPARAIAESSPTEPSGEAVGWKSLRLWTTLSLAFSTTTAVVFLVGLALFAWGYLASRPEVAGFARDSLGILGVGLGTTSIAIGIPVFIATDLSGHPRSVAVGLLCALATCLTFAWVGLHAIWLKYGPGGDDPSRQPDGSRQVRPALRQGEWIG
ncbi:MAG: hypothetical protein U0800_20030, partial [Isosphaeraceae bacterium]